MLIDKFICAYCVFFFWRIFNLKEVWVCIHSMFFIFYICAVVHTYKHTHIKQKPWPCRTERREKQPSDQEKLKSLFSPSPSDLPALPLPVLTVLTVHTLRTLHTPELDESKRGEVTPLISWCGTCPQTEPLILLIDSFAVFPYSCLLVVFVRGAELIHRLMEFGLGGSVRTQEGHCCDCETEIKILITFIIFPIPPKQSIKLKYRKQEYSFVQR